MYRSWPGCRLSLIGLRFQRSAGVTPFRHSLQKTDPKTDPKPLRPEPRRGLLITETSNNRPKPACVSQVKPRLPYNRNPIALETSWCDRPSSTDKTMLLGHVLFLDHYGFADEDGLAPHRINSATRREQGTEKADEILPSLVCTSTTQRIR
ncbi:hypothetical protein SODALDRAFT_111827 [Sodiomyces alkalinus F11]|uniref:Uncharacterized protein n=1 Tax=Sodiomyces alkalinus (strain CBS 110278 / VKM F-3762 / F11) TaxID=1314773 RepID=A0A3N2Q339_SODAK|nr:hypothetical protein SODALDRAFT_111827 [Sodiomyces alkalinus F11]ROT41088.1 hypothetical protein SODALDRAFT_111827 [Sodiomyces alkalinus F11]